MLSFLSAPLALLCISTLSLVAPLTALATNHKPPPKKTLTVENGLKYAYIYSPAKANQPTFLLLHGFPSSSSDWHNQVSDLTAAGYGVLAPDMLGYAGTSKPEEVEAYALSKMTSHVAKILDKEGLTEIIGVGHDWGSGFLGKMWNYYPQYFSSLVFMSVPYTPPSPFDLDGLNELTKAAFGYETYGYMYFLNETDAGEILDCHTKSAISLVYPQNSELHITDLCPRGTAKAWVQADKTTGLPAFESKKERAARIKDFEDGGWTGPTNWYKASVRNIDSERESQIPLANYAITKPVIFVGGDIDYVTRPELLAQTAEQGKAEGWLPNVEYKLVKGGSHWLMLEQPKQIFDILDGLAKSL